MDGLKLHTIGSGRNKLNRLQKITYTYRINHQVEDLRKTLRRHELFVSKVTKLEMILIVVEKNKSLEVC